MTRTFQFVDYALNCGGPPRLQRLAAVHRWIQRYLSLGGHRGDTYFLTSSEADTLLFAERLPSFKLPTPAAAAAAALEPAAYKALAKQWVWSSLGLMRPDLLIVDSWPRGVFGELSEALRLAPRRVFLHRALPADVEAQADYQAMLRQYDLVLVPEYEETSTFTAAPELGGRVRFTGPILARESFERTPRLEARAQLGIPTERLAVLVAGGELATRARAELAGDDGLHLVLWTGPSYRGPWAGADNLCWLPTPSVADRLAAFDVAICDAGDAVLDDLLHAGVPAVVCGLDDTPGEAAATARRAVAAGAALPLGGAPLAEILHAWRDPAPRGAAADAARRLVPRSHARDVAAEILRLVLPANQVKNARRAITEPLLVLARDYKVGHPVVIALLQGLSQSDAPSTPAAATHEDVAEVLGAIRSLGVPPWPATRVVNALAHKLPSAATPRQRAEAGAVVLRALAPFADWSGAAALLSALPAEPRGGAAAVAERLAALLRACHEAGADLYAVIERLSRARDGGERSLLELLERATPRPAPAVTAAPAGGMYRVDEIEVVHLEMTTKCNARCPQCPHTVGGGPDNPNLPLTELSVADVAKMFAPPFVQQLKGMFICGNYGDGMVARDTAAVFEYFRQHNAAMWLTLHTNGSGRGAGWWQGLAQQAVRCVFAIDGLEDTNHIYRRGTHWRQIMDSVESFIGAGGKAQWHYLVFRHNEHQVDAARELAEQLGFERFQAIRTPRFLNNGEVVERRAVVDRHGGLEYYLEVPREPSHQNPAFVQLRGAAAERGSYDRYLETTAIDCKAVRERKLYASAEGMLFPCCWTAQIHQPEIPEGTGELWPLLRRLPGGAQSLDAREHSLAKIVSGPFFTRAVPRGWEPGATRLRTCARACGEVNVARADMDA